MEIIDKEKIEAVLFDLDGVLINSFSTWYLAFADTLKKFDREVIEQKEFRKQHWGYDVYTNMEKLGLGKKGAEYAKSQFIKHIDKIHILPETKSILTLIEKKIGLVTSTPSEIAIKILKRYSLNGYFESIIGIDKVKKPKPNPEPLLKACKELGISPQKAIFIGDNETDVKAGRAAGCKVIGLGIDADLKIDSLDDLKEIFQ